MPRSSLQALHKALNALRAFVKCLGELSAPLIMYQNWSWSCAMRDELMPVHICHLVLPGVPYKHFIRPCIGLRALVKCLGGTLGVTKYLVRINKDRYHIEVQHASTGQCSVLPWVPFKHFAWIAIHITPFRSFRYNVKCLGELLVILNMHLWEVGDTKQ